MAVAAHAAGKAGQEAPQGVRPSSEAHNRKTCENGRNEITAKGRGQSVAHFVFFSTISSLRGNAWNCVARPSARQLIQQALADCLDHLLPFSACPGR